jgi:hypothetical protein
LTQCNTSRARSRVRINLKPADRDGAVTNPK